MILATTAQSFLMKSQEQYNIIKKNKDLGRKSWPARHARYDRHTDSLCAPEQGSFLFFGKLVFQWIDPVVMIANDPRSTVVLGSGIA